MTIKDQLPPLPEIDPVFHHPDHHMKWTAQEIKWIKDYAQDYALAALAQQAQEPVGDRYFTHSTDWSFEEYATREEAIKSANAQIEQYREDAIQGAEWPGEVDSVCWGVILGRSKEIDTSSEDHESVDYQLCDTTPQPQPAPQVPAPVEWLPIETAPVGREMFVVIGVTSGNGFTGGRPYTTDPYCVWQPEKGEFLRWPHNWPPTHWQPLPNPPKDQS